MLAVQSNKAIRKYEILITYMQVWRIKSVGIALCIFFMTIVSSCGSVEDQFDDSLGTVLRVAAEGELRIIDPLATTAGPTLLHGYMIYDTLVGFDANNTAQPQMLESWTVSNDGLVYSFVLRPNLLWHDGTSVSAIDCVASIRRWAARDGSGKIVMSRVKEIRVVNDLSFEIELVQKFDLLISAFAKSNSYPLFIMPARLANTASTEQISEPIGSGPYKFLKDEWLPGSRAVYQKFEEYVPRSEPSNGFAGAKIANFDRIERLTIRDPQTALSAIRQNEIDHWENPPLDLLPALKLIREARVYTAGTTQKYAIFRLNHLQPPFDDLRAREAMLWIVNQEHMARVVSIESRYSQTCGSIYGCGTPLEMQIGTEAVLSYSEEKAIRLFKESGWDFSKPMVLMMPSDRYEYKMLLLVLADSLHRIGINADVQVMDWSTISQRRQNRGPVENGGWNVFPTGMNTSQTADPMTNMYSFVCESAWVGWPCSARVAKLQANYLDAESDGKRYAIAGQLQEAVLAEALYVPAVQYSNLRVTRSGVIGVLTPYAISVYWNIQRTKADEDPR